MNINGAIMKVGIIFSAFDLLRAGPIKMLEEAKRHCDYLIVGLQTDPAIDRPEKNRPRNIAKKALLNSILIKEIIAFRALA